MKLKAMDMIHSQNLYIFCDVKILRISMFGIASRKNISTYLSLWIRYPVVNNTLQTEFYSIFIHTSTCYNTLSGKLIWNMYLSYRRRII